MNESELELLQYSLINITIFRLVIDNSKYQ